MSKYFIVSELLNAKIFSILSHYDLTENFSFGRPMIFSNRESIHKVIQKMLNNDRPHYFKDENDAKEAVVVIKNSRTPAIVHQASNYFFVCKYYIAKKVSNRYHNPKYIFTKSLILS